MAFKPIPILNLITQAGNARLDNASALKALREKAIVPSVKLAVENFKQWKAIADKAHDDSKKLIATVSGKVKDMERPDWIPNIYTIGEVKGAVDILKLTSKHLNDENKAYADAFENGGFRADWRKTIKQAFPQLTDNEIEQALGGPLQMRGKIIADNRAVIATRARVDEYLKRSEILYRTAETSRQKASANIMGAHRALGKSITDLDKHVTTCKQAIDKIEGKLDTIDKLLKTKAAKWETMAKGAAAERDENTKKASGGLKTLKQELELAKKVLAKTPQTPKELIAQLTAREKTAKDFDGSIVELKKKAEAQNTKLKAAGVKV